MIEKRLSPPDLTWQTYTQITLPCWPEDPQLVEAGASAIAGRILALNLPAARLERLKTALEEASYNIQRQAARHEPLLPLCIRVFVSGKIPAEAAGDLGDQDGNAEENREPSQERASRGWGFFLVEKTVDPAGLRQEGAHHTIDLFLYQEGEQPD